MLEAVFERMDAVPGPEAPYLGSPESCHALLPRCLSCCSVAREAGKLAEEGLRRARESKHLFSLGLRCQSEGRGSQYRREPKLARAHSEEAIALSEEYGFRMASGHFHHGWSLANWGNLTRDRRNGGGNCGLSAAGWSSWRQLLHRAARLRLRQDWPDGRGDCHAERGPGPRRAHWRKGRPGRDTAAQRRSCSDARRRATAEAERCFRAALESRGPGGQMVGAAHHVKSRAAAARQAGATRRARCSPKSTAGSPRASTPPT